MDIGKFETMKLATQKKRGVAMIIVLVALSAAAFIMAYGAIFLGIGELDLGYTSSGGGEALSLTDGCLEEAIGRLRVDSAYTGSTLTLTRGSCTINISVAGSNRTIDILGTVGSLYNKKIQAMVTLPPDRSSVITINSWQEMTD